ncbi:MAG: hypothetical protein A4S17_13550 [Proteobacteria bacterium HN_bin10]|nr:MAG: hypothetical protein A4S17_13550 [Proteobacteria bacterium HN_bin10]
MNQPDTRSPQTVARIAGALYLLIIVVASFGEFFVRSPLVVIDDAAATAANISASGQLFRWGAGAQLITLVCDVALAALFYLLMRPVNEVVALLSCFFRLGAILIVAASIVFYTLPIMLLQDASLQQGLSTEIIHSLSLLSLRLHTAAYTVCLFLFGVHCLLLGWLIASAKFLPRLIGVALILAGFAYVANSFSFFVYPPATALIFPVMVPLAFAAEAALALWLLFVGVKADAWRTQADAVSAGEGP